MEKPIDKDILRLYTHLQQGKCCSQALVSMGLELNGNENRELEECARALCLGVHSGLLCGALTGGAMLLSLFDPSLAESTMIPALTAWFEETYGETYGGIRCRDILADNPANKMTRCPRLVENTWRKVREILEDEGFDVEGLLENLPD